MSLQEWYIDQHNVSVSPHHQDMLQISTAEKFQHTADLQVKNQNLESCMQQMYLKSDRALRIKQDKIQLHVFLEHLQWCQT